LENSVRFPHLLRAEILDGLDAAFKKSFINACNIAAYDKPTVIYEQDMAARCVMILAHGHVDVTYLGNSGIEMFIIRLRSGTAIAEMEVISELPCMATCKTSKNAIILECPRALLDTALLQPVFLKNMISAFYKRLSYVNWSKYLTQFCTVEERLRGYLYVLSANSLTITETQANLASMIGCSRQTVNRELVLLKEAKLIAPSGSGITVLDRETLGRGVLD